MEEGKKRTRPRYVMLRYRHPELYLTFYFLSSLDKVFRDVLDLYNPE